MTPIPSTEGERNLSWSPDGKHIAIAKDAGLAMLTMTETGYVVERSSDAATFGVIATLGANVTSYANTGLTRATTYYYRVKAVRDGVPCGPSNVASAKTLK